MNFRLLYTYYFSYLYEVNNIVLVFLAAPGPAKCYECLAENAHACFSSQDDQTCSSDSGALGTTHCGSAVATVRDRNGNIT